MSRAAMGLRSGLCGQCRSGWVPGEKQTFDPRCVGCRAKLAAGKRTGNEPRPKAGLRDRKRLSPEKFRRVLEGKARERMSRPAVEA